MQTILQHNVEGCNTFITICAASRRRRNGDFYEIIYSKHEEKLDAWLVKLEKFNILELQTYVNGIRPDIVAVKNGIAMQYNNGLAEGSVNKLKGIKRIMYGRNSFELLKAKVLLHEQFCCEIN